MATGGGSCSNLGSLAKINSKLKDEEEDIPFEKYLAESGSSDDDSSGDDEAGGGGLISGLEDSELMNANAQELVDKDLTNLLGLMKKFPPPTQK